uniref:DAGKc domain-containing protein n=1 Tax=Globisporangium ultimum (strain ATCC 200006 / CBS 805.95 / DAOM BR144) TaxID=431595 RepID=K3WTK5_GLOUD
MDVTPGPSSSSSGDDSTRNSAAAPTRHETDADLHSLLARLQLHFVHRSPKRMWLGRPMRVTFELALTHLRLHMQHEIDEPKKSKEKHHAKRLHRELLWQDVLGAHILTHDGEHLDRDQINAALASDAAKTKSYLLGVFACPAMAKRAAQGAPDAWLKKRRLFEAFYQFQGAQLQDVVALRRWINYLADPRTASLLAKTASIVALTPEELPARKFLVIINPVGGAGKGVQTYESKVAPIFKYAGIDTTVEVTEHAGHATEIVTSMPLQHYDCVLPVGGDGSLSEITQGLMKRPDWNCAIRQPIGIIPSGSGNGLSHSILHECQERGKPINAAFVLAKGAAQELDITSVRNGKETMYSFLSLEWASIADVDVISEKFRALGGLRFGLVYAHHILFSKKEYPGSLWYLEDDLATSQHEPSRYFETHSPESTEYPPLDLIDEENKANLGGTWKEVKGPFRLVWVMGITHAASDAIVAPSARFDDGYNYITIVDGSVPRKEFLSVLLALEDGAHVERESVQYIRTRAYKVMPERHEDLLCVDGEVFEGPALECQVHRGLGRLITLPRAC